jgi:hypothetical protein
MNFFGYTVDTVGLKSFLLIASIFVIGRFVMFCIDLIKKIIRKRKTKKIVILSNKLDKEIKRGVK